MFRKRFNFMTVAGIHIGIDMSWLFIALLLSWTLASVQFPFLYPNLPVALYWFMGVAAMFGLFICITLHELGHALVARYFKIPISQITLFIFGGVAEIKKEPTSPKVELLIAIAGPIVSIFLAIGLYFITYIGAGYHFPIHVLGITGYLATINVLIVVFNLIPAFPLDGGRILRAILWKIKGDLKWATKIATRMGVGFGFLFLFLGIFLVMSGNFLSGIWLAIIGLFLQKTAGSSQTQFFIKEQLQGAKVSKFMKDHPDCIPPHITIQDFIHNYVYKSCHHFYPVVEGNKAFGILTLQEIKALPADQWGHTTVQKIMIPLSSCLVVAPTSNAFEALELMQQTEFPTLLVIQEGTFVGILTSQDLFKLISLQLELHSKEVF